MLLILPPRQAPNCLPFNIAVPTILAHIVVISPLDEMTGVGVEETDPCTSLEGHESHDEEGLSTQRMGR